MMKDKKTTTLTIAPLELLGIAEFKEDLQKLPKEERKKVINESFEKWRRM